MTKSEVQNIKKVFKSILDNEDATVRINDTMTFLTELDSKATETDTATADATGLESTNKKLTDELTDVKLQLATSKKDFINKFFSGEEIKDTPQVEPEDVLPTFDEITNAIEEM